MPEILCLLEAQPSSVLYNLYHRPLDSYKKGEIPLKVVYLEHLGGLCGLNQQEGVASQNWSIK